MTQKNGATVALKARSASLLTKSAIGAAICALVSAGAFIAAVTTTMSSITNIMSGGFAGTLTGGGPGASSGNDAATIWLVIAVAALVGMGVCIGFGVKAVADRMKM